MNIKKIKDYNGLNHINYVSICELRMALKTNKQTYCSPLVEKAMAPHSSTLPWKIPWTEEPGRLQSMGSLTERLHFHFSLSCIGEGKGNPLQCSCLENPRDGGAWWAAISGVAQSRTRMKQLSSSSSKSSELNMDPDFALKPER